MDVTLDVAADRVSDESRSVREGEDPFAAFTSETADLAAADTPPQRTSETVVDWPRFVRLGRRALIGALAIVVVAALGIAGVQRLRARWFTAAPGHLTVMSIPSGAEVSIDGTARGATPLTIELAAGTHEVALRRAGTTRQLTAAVKPNAEIVQVVDLPPAAPVTGSLSVTSEPSGMRLAIDGTAHGTTPALVGQLPPGEHTVTLSGKNASADRRVTVQAGSTATLMVSLPAETAAGGVGAITIASPIDVQLFEGETLIGSSRSARLFLPAGAHSITAVNEALGYRHVIAVDVKAGGSSKIAVPIPNGALSVNAQPWAEVFVDGKSLGQTPIGNYALAIGSHELVLRHPQFGERLQTIVIGVGRTARVGVDLRK